MASTRIPVNPVALYWVYWSPFKRLVDFPTANNIIFLFHAFPPSNERTIVSGVLQNPGGETGRVELRKPGGVIGTNLNADIATCRARGQKILVSVGGAGGQVYLTDHSTSHPLNVPTALARANNFIQSIKDMNVSLGGSGTTLAFDGIDWNNFEGAEFSDQGEWMSYIGTQLRAYYGNGFIFTAPPAVHGAEPGGQAESDRTLLAELYMNGVLDWLCPQFYDGSQNDVPATVSARLDYYNTAVSIGGQSVQIPRDYIGIGFGIAELANYWTAAEAASAYTQMVNEGKTPKGAFNFSNWLDTADSFAAVVAPVITNNVAEEGQEDPLVSPFEMVLSNNFTDGATTTAQLEAPSGKTGSDFSAGRMAETFPTASIDLASGKYTELEFCVKGGADVVEGQKYKFRVTRNGTVLNTYSVYPKWTIGTVEEAGGGGGGEVGGGGGISEPNTQTTTGRNIRTITGVRSITI